MLRHGVAGVIMEAMSIAESPPTEGRDRLGPTRRRVLAHLQEVADPLGSDTLATALGLHANTVRFHLDALIRDGLVRRLLDRQGRQGRPRVLYSAAPEGPSVSDLPFRALAETLLAFVRDHDDVLSPEAIGESWGRSMVGDSAETSIEALVDEVNRLGLTSRLTTDEVGELVEIVRCPFRDLTVGGDQTVCRIHLGMLRGYLSAGDAEHTVTELRPWVGPELCIARLARVAPDRTSACEAEDS